MLDFIIFAFQILENSGFLYNIVGEFLPLHISISVDVDLIEEIGEIANQSVLTIG